MTIPQWKYALYDTGRYEFVVPPVYTGHWTREDWINWIDACNGWRP